jgi:GT2 family glycosyltransferase
MTMRDTTEHTGATAGQGKLVAVVVTFNRLDQLRVTLKALFDAPADQLAAIIVLDNASRDGTSSWLKSQTDPRLDVVRSKKNVGGAGGFAKGMRHALEVHDPDWIVVMDDDGRPEPDALARFHALDLTGFDGLAAACRHPDGVICEMNRPAFHPFWNKALLAKTAFGGGLSAVRLSHEAYEEPGLRRIDGASFVGFFVRASVVAKQGYPDPELFLYGDDTIYTLELTQAGHRLAFEPSVRFEHDNKTYRVAFTRIRPMWKVYYYYRNLLILCRFVTWASFIPVLFWLIPWWFFSVRHYGTDKRVFLKLFGLAIWDGLRGRTGRSHVSILKIARGSVTSAAAHGDSGVAATSPAPGE